jgi:MSHA biogenesis protein MshJ
MKVWWARQAARIDALSLRERVFVFLAVLACFIALADTVWLTPAQGEHEQLKQRFARQGTELQRLRDEFRTVAMPADTSKPVREELAAVKVRLEGVNQGIREAQASTQAAATLRDALVYLLRKQEGLTLVRTAALPGSGPLAAPASGASQSPGPVPVAASSADNVSRQGIELTVAGPYPQLTAYVQSLEKALPAVRWGAMKLSSEKSPPELTLQLMLVGLQP